MIKKWFSILLAVCLLITATPVALAIDINDSSVFIKQTADRCTYAAAAMVLRRRTIIDNGSDWSSITQDDVREASKANANGGGMRNNYTYRGYTMGSQVLSDSYSTATKKSILISLLKDHPEGIVAYNANRSSCGQWHAITMTDYDASTDTFYCAEPAGSKKGRITFSESTIRGNGQEGKLYYINKLWYITNRSGGSTTPPTPGIPVGTTSKPEVSVNGQTVNVSWSYSGSGTSIDVYVIVSPWDWSGIRYKQNVTGNSCTFTDVVPGYYNVFTVAQPNNRQVQSDWAEFVVQEPHTTHEKGEYLWYESLHPHYNYWKCSVCGENFTDGSTSTDYSCSQCHPEHTKGDFRYTASDHPHYNYYACSACGKEFSDGSTSINYSCSQCHPEHTKGEFRYTSTDHPHNNYYACSVCGREFADGSTVPDNNCSQCHWEHIWDSGIVTTEPTIHTTGIKTYSCTVCGEQRTENLPAIPASFEDVSPDAFYADPVEWAVKQKITSGISETQFGPNNACTRGQIVTLLWRAAGSPEPQTNSCQFVDITPRDYFYKAVLWAVENQITSGTDTTHFSPYAKCTRAQAITFIWRTEGKPTSENRASFSDVSPKSYYADAVSWGVEYGVTSGMGNNKFGSDETCTRGQIVTFIYRDKASK